MKIGILALQGAFIEHEQILAGLNTETNMGTHIETIEIRQLSDLQKEIDGLIIPGGESTVIGKLLHDLELFHPLQEMIMQGLPVFGTCAGAILLAEKIANDHCHYFASLPVEIQRNAYGRQLGSFQAYENFGKNKIPMIFIRAPYIKSVLADDVEVLSIVDNKIAAVRYHNQLITCFHPELTKDTTVHQYFIDIIKKSKL
ncbi:MAG: pyridoxal 5'-phosphate synthase glutaminase subunit PdxT [Clostridiales bacterium]